MVIQIDGKNIHYERTGRGEPILFVHGWGGSINSLRKLATFAQPKHETIILDLPGFGKSENPEKEWGLEEYSNCVASFIKHMELQNLTYFGHSFGGSVGIYISSHNPTLISTLVLCNSAFRRSNKQSKIVTFLKKNVYPYLPFSQKFESSLRYILYRIFFPHSDLVKYPYLESNFRKIMTQDLVDFAPKISVPTLIVWGEEDTYTPVSFAYELAKKIPNSFLKIFPEKKHNLPLLYPELVWEEMNQFIEKNV